MGKPFPELPSGLMGRIAHDTRAMDGLFSLGREQQEALAQYIQGAQSGEEAKSRIEETVEALENAGLPFGMR